MNHYSHEAFKKLMKIEENRICFDCKKISCQWASINNGIFLCTNCSGNHRGYGVEKSYIRSILWDNWTENQIKYMINGGNKSLNEFIQLYSIDKNEKKDSKFYGTKMMEYYRNRLKNIVEGKEFNEFPPSIEEAFKESKENLNPNKEDKFSSFGSDVQNHKDDNNNNSIGDNIKNWMDKAYEGTKSTINNFELGNKFSNAKNSIIDTGNKIIEKIQIKKLAQKTGDTISYYFHFFMGKEHKDDSSTTNENE